MTKTTIDDDAGTVTVSNDGEERHYRLDSAEGFEAVSDAWLRAGWDAKYVYSFTWMGRPIIQLPEDMIRIQEVIWNLKPDVIVETGIAHGGSLVFYASLFEASGHGRVIGIDIDIRAPNRAAMESHPLFGRIAMIEGSSRDPAVIGQVRAQIQPDERVLIVLDSSHQHDHVLAELRAFAEIVTPGSYIVATDGIQQRFAGAPRSAADWSWNNPRQAVVHFLSEDPRFALDEPAWLFNESVVKGRVTYWPDAYLKRLR